MPAGGKRNAHIQPRADHPSRVKRNSLASTSSLHTHSAARKAPMPQVTANSAEEVSSAIAPASDASAEPPTTAKNPIHAMRLCSLVIGYAIDTSGVAPKATTP